MGTWPHEGKTYGVRSCNYERKFRRIVSGAVCGMQKKTLEKPGKMSKNMHGSDNPTKNEC